MWSFSDMSLPTATLVGSIANWTLLACLIGGVIATFFIVRAADIKEEHWAHDRSAANTRIAELNDSAKKSEERIASLNNETARLQADNISLQTVLLPRHVGLIGIDQEPPAKKWFAGFE